MRLDTALVARGLARSRGQARDLIQSGVVQVNGARATKSAQPVGERDDLTAVTDPWVSRAAHKLVGALEATDLRVAGARALDAGASTGGFTQVLLEAGAAHVHSIDVGHGQLVPHLRADPRVTARDGLNLRDLTLADVGGEPVDLVVADVSFISLRLLVAPLRAVTRAGGSALLMVKPQFEVGRGGLDSRGVLTDPAAAPGLIDAVAAAAQLNGWRELWRGPSPLPGENGNQEHFLHLVAGPVGGAR